MANRTLSDVIAERVIQLRKDAGLTREEFVARCQEIAGAASGDFSVGAMANIETGRRLSDGTRRRKVDAEEVAVFAEALNVPPVWLMTDPRSPEPTSLYGDVEANPWVILAWMIGAEALRSPVGREWTEASEILGWLFDLTLAVRYFERVASGWERGEQISGLVEGDPRRNSLQAILDRMEPFWDNDYPPPPLPDVIHEGLGELLAEQASDLIERAQETITAQDAAGGDIPREQLELPRQLHMTAGGDRRLLRRLAVLLWRVTQYGGPRPSVPDLVLERARELNVTMPPERVTLTTDQVRRR